jgi:hypothetical protein
MDIALGVSVTPTTVHMLLVEGEKADGLIIETDAFDIAAVEGGLAPSASEQASAAILRTQQSASSSGHHLIACGVAVGQDADTEEFRKSLEARGVEEVTVVTELQAAAALARAVGRAVGYAETGLVVLKSHTAMLSVVNSADGSITEVASRSMDDTDPLCQLADMLGCLDDREVRPQGLFIGGSGRDLVRVKSHLEATFALPVIVPEEPDWALARGAALIAANAPHFEASTIGLAYAQDPDGGELVASTVLPTGPLALTDVVTQRAPVDDSSPEPTENASEPARRQPLLPVGSVAATILVIAFVTLTMALAVSIRPTVAQRPGLPAEAVLPVPPIPSTVPQSAPSTAYQAASAPSLPASPPTTTVVLQPPPRTVVTQAPALKPQTDAASDSEERAPTISPVAAAPAISDPPPAEAPPLPIPAAAPSAPAIPPSALLPMITAAPIPQPPVQQPSVMPSLWGPPSIWIGPPPVHSQFPLAQQNPSWLQIPLWPVQRSAPDLAPPQVVQPATPLLPRFSPWPQRSAPDLAPPQVVQPATPLLPRLSPWPQPKTPAGVYADEPGGSGPLWPYS